jgi:polysaccharide pyruvyl transferase WcaK-like protein
MHACISACCQFTPTVCLAYSRKFRGVMGTISYSQFVVDMQTSATDELLEKIKVLFFKREEMAGILKKEIPAARQKLGHLLDEVELS